MADSIKRSVPMIEAAYFLARYGEARPSGSTMPPAELDVSSWKEAYARFHKQLGEGRSLTSFSNSLKNARDVYDAHLDTGRVGWRQAGENRPPVDLPSFHQSVWDTWAHRARKELWRRVREYTDLFVGTDTNIDPHDVNVQRGEEEDRVCRTEGNRKVVISTRAERNSTLRAAALKKHGKKCAVCEWSFEQAYGPWGEGYAEVHHLEPLGSSSEVRETDVERDLIVLCANCHRMVHRKRDLVLSVDELKSKLNVSAIVAWANDLARRK